MNDYKELIKRLRYGDYMMNSDPFTLNTKMIEWSAKAADAIEQLVKERDDEREATDEWQHDYFELARKCSQLEKELDAAIDCIYAIEDDLDRGNDNVWAREHIKEWRGAQEDNDEAD